MNYCQKEYNVSNNVVFSMNVVKKKKKRLQVSSSMNIKITYFCPCSLEQAIFSFNS